MEKLTCPADILYEKEWRAAYGNRCNAIFLSDTMGDNESMRKLFHREGSTHATTPLVGIFYDYYKDHDKEKMLDRVKQQQPIAAVIIISVCLSPLRNIKESAS